MTGAMTRSVGYIDSVLTNAGSIAARDVLLGAPPMWLMGKLVYRPA